MNDTKLLAMRALMNLLSKSIKVLDYIGVSESEKKDEGLRSIKQNIEKARTGVRNETNYKF